MIAVSNDVAVVTPSTDLDAAAAELLREALAEAVRDHHHVIVDLHAAPTIDSAGLSLLVRFYNEAKARGGTFSLAAPSRYVVTVLHTMKLHQVFTLYPDVEAALLVRQLDPEPSAAAGPVQ
ncbi:STAS domain-containing protein [Actinoplanes sp. LDG1-06]|uniref:Anti-sigma factor antagonist n=1 Tax=Paractinoplanes ovalisporus TaxID=2810368 RepID=A0ABS2A456_9ACTN|nr:STAS domain-containing protein [Actinoplanes ovalisporus]MBM2614621.1 STAS domain-containing protein [Actinoplanes ovalisporus]